MDITELIREIKILTWENSGLMNIILSETGLSEDHGKRI